MYVLHPCKKFKEKRRGGGFFCVCVVKATHKSLNATTTCLAAYSQTQFAHSATLQYAPLCWKWKRFSRTKYLYCIRTKAEVFVTKLLSARKARQSTAHARLVAAMNASNCCKACNLEFNSLVTVHHKEHILKWSDLNIGPPWGHGELLLSLSLLLRVFCVLF